MRKSILAVAVAAATVVSGANAAGFYLKEQSVVGQGRAFAGSAAGTDGASAAYFNPAGIVGLERQVEVGVHVISPDVTVKDNGTNGTTIVGSSPAPAALVAQLNQADQEPYSAKAVPNAHFIHPIDENTAFGLSIGAPFGFGNEYEKSGFTAFDAIENELTTIELGASFAKRINETTSLSLGLMVQDLALEQTAIAGGATLGTLKGSSQDFGYVLGLQKEFGATTVGASYRSAVEHSVQGTQSFTSRTTGAPATQPFPSAASSISLPSTVNVSAPFDLPDIFAVGFKHQNSDQTSVYADITYYGWSKVKESPVTLSEAYIGGLAPAGTEIANPQFNYQDTVSFSLGIEHNYPSGLTARAGIHHDPTPTNDTDRSTSTPDADRTWLSAGLSKEVSPALTLDGAITYILVEESEVDKQRQLLLDGTPTAPTGVGLVTTKAKASGNVGILSLGLRYKF